MEGAQLNALNKFGKFFKFLAYDQVGTKELVDGAFTTYDHIHRFLHQGPILCEIRVPDSAECIVSQDTYSVVSSRLTLVRLYDCVPLDILHNAIVSSRGAVLNSIPMSQLDQSLCLEAIRLNGLVLEHVPVALVTPEMCLEAVQQNGNALKYVPGALKTARVCMEAIKQNGVAIYYVPECFLTRHTWAVAVRRIVASLKIHLDEDSSQTDV